MVAGGQSGEKEIFEITARGRTIGASGNHPFLSLRDERKPGRQHARYAPRWVAAEDLREGDLVAIPTDLPDYGQPAAMLATRTEPSTYKTRIAGGRCNKKQKERGTTRKVGENKGDKVKSSCFDLVRDNHCSSFLFSSFLLPTSSVLSNFPVLALVVEVHPFVLSKWSSRCCYVPSLMTTKSGSMCMMNGAG